VIWDHGGLPVKLAAFRDVHVAPSAEYPFGRKGLALAGAWRQLAGSADVAGMLLLDGDVAADPVDHDAITACIDSDPEAVWTAPVRIWPVSTYRDDWVWAHWETEASQHLDLTANWFSFNFTYLPRRLIGACLEAGLEGWQFPRVDAEVSRVARRMRVPGRVAAECRPVHMHYVL